jgi:hypothetical protein
VALVVLGASLGAACGSDGGSDGGAATTSTLVPSSSGDSCTDPTGDLDLPVGVSADAPGLSGIDLVEASATVDGDQLDISITTAGPIDQAPAGTYVVAQGEPLGAYSFELRMVHGSDGWSSTLITWPSATEARQSLPVTPTVDGRTLTARVPLSSLPNIALAMQFGSSATVGDAIVIDDCSSLNGG